MGRGFARLKLWRSCMSGQPEPLRTLDHPDGKPSGMPPLRAALARGADLVANYQYGYPY